MSSVWNWRTKGITYFDTPCPKCECSKQIGLSQKIGAWNAPVRYETLRLCCNACNHHWDTTRRLPPLDEQERRNKRKFAGNPKMIVEVVETATSNVTETYGAMHAAGANRKEAALNKTINSETHFVRQVDVTGDPNY